MAEAREALENLDKAKATWVDEILQDKWQMEGDRGSKLFYKSFRGMASAKQIPALVKDDGAVVTSWSDMATVTTEFFKKVLGPPRSADLSISSSDLILDILSDKLSPEEKAALNAPISIEELGLAARGMKKGKCPGPDGIPVEFFQQMWQLAGPPLLLVINRGMERETFPKDLTLGHIVLLPKKRDQRFLVNKRPITLLNVAYKIGAKAFQNRLTPLLQRLISPQQFAFLPGRNIHHSLLLLGEMLQQAASSGEEHVLLKLDVIKAFDSLEWPFLLAVVERMGMSGLLTKFLKAGFATASSSVVLNGIPTESFSLTRLVRQGCPLSPLLFILAFDLLSLLLTRAVDRGEIVGVNFPNVGIKSLQNLYADDIYAVIRAMLRYVVAFKIILTQFGNASGLHFAWEETVASSIPVGPPPRELGHLPWNWEDNTNASPLLGAPVAQTIAQEILETSLLTKVEGKITKFKARGLTLASRLIVANSLILGCIWYLLILWAGADSFLKKLQRLVDHFLWDGRNRVAGAFTSLSKQEGGLGLINITAQYRALAGNFMVWVAMHGEHPLRRILQGHIGQASLRRWGNKDLTWMVSTCGHMKMAGSSTWKNLCRGWESLRKHLELRSPINREEWGSLSLWRPHVIHRNQARANCLTRQQQQMKAAGLQVMADMLDDLGHFISWEVAEGRGVPLLCRRAFDGLIENLEPTPIFQPSQALHKF